MIEKFRAATKGWWTIAFGALITMLGGLTAADLVPYVGETWAGVVIAAIGVVIMALRVITNTPVGSKVPEGGLK